jgi:acyl-CoA thioester hydrolase
MAAAYSFARARGKRLRGTRPAPATAYDGPVHEKRMEIRGRDLNRYRHVHSTVYAVYLEECRNELIERLTAEITGPSDYVLARVAVDYRRELTTDDGHVVARCAVTRIGTSSVTFREQVTTAAGALAAESEAVIVAHDPATGRSRPLAEAERRAFESARDEG